MICFFKQMFLRKKFLVRFLAGHFSLKCELLIIIYFPDRILKNVSMFLPISYTVQFSSILCSSHLPLFVLLSLILLLTMVWLVSCHRQLLGFLIKACVDYLSLFCSFLFLGNRSIIMKRHITDIYNYFQHSFN